MLDLGYFGEENLNLPEDGALISIGHSLELIKLASLDVKFNGLIGVQAFINFLGFDLQLHKKTQVRVEKDDTALSNGSNKYLDILL